MITSNADRELGDVATEQKILIASSEAAARIKGLFLQDTQIKKLRSATVAHSAASKYHASIVTRISPGGLLESAALFAGNGVRSAARSCAESLRSCFHRWRSYRRRLRWHRRFPLISRIFSLQGWLVLAAPLPSGPSPL